MREQLLQIFALISKSSARKKVYSQKARLEGRDDLSLLLRAIAESESVQARRVMNALRGQIDRTEGYVTTIFSEEIRGMVKEYEALLNQVGPGDDKAMATALSQLLEAERRTLLLNPQKQEEEGISPASGYYICQFCGYIAEEVAPEHCPICQAQCSAFSKSG